MTPAAALKHFRTKTEMARVCGVSKPTVSYWFRCGAIPEGRQYQIEIATGGALRARRPASRRPASGVTA